MQIAKKKKKKLTKDLWEVNQEYVVSINQERGEIQEGVISSRHVMQNDLVTEKT